MKRRKFDQTRNHAILKIRQNLLLWDLESDIIIYFSYVAEGFEISIKGAYRFQSYKFLQTM